MKRRTPCCWAAAMALFVMSMDSRESSHVASGYGFHACRCITESTPAKASHQSPCSVICACTNSSEPVAPDDGVGSL